MLAACKIAAATLGIKDLCDEKPTINPVFMEHLSEYGISYGTQEEYLFRQAIFLKNDAENKAINADPANTFTVGHNFMSTWTDAEYKRLLGYRAPKIDTIEVTVLSEVDLPSSVDWRKKGAVNAVKNQGQCGSCWAFSATAAIEGHHAIQQGKLVSLAEQQLVDCDRSDSGCNGGWQADAMKYVEGHGQTLEKDYRYTAKRGSCKASHMRSAAGVTKINKVQSNSASALKAAIARGPTSVTVEADKSVFGRYKGGILNSRACGTKLDHAITAVGYGSHNGQDYYIVRNSWGASWGERGYINIATQSGRSAGICGIQQSSVWPNTK